MTYNAIAFLFLSLLVVLAVPPLLRRPIRLAPGLLLLAALLRVVGSTARYEVIFRFYDGLGDAVLYYYDGLEHARRLWAFDFAPLGLDHWFGGGQWWGTRFLENLSGLAVGLVGPTMRGEFLLFSLLSLAGLYLIARASYNSLSEVASTRFATWLFVWPSLWFWPSSVGKEAVTIFAIGLVTLGWSGSGDRVRWPIFLIGLAVSFAIRPHVAAVVGFAALIGYWVGGWERFTVRRAVESLLLVVVFLFTLRGVTSFFAQDTRFELESADLEGLSDFVGFWNQQTITGGSSIGAVPAGLLGSPFAFVNIWMRPFPWEAHNLTALVSAVEIVLLWWLVWKNRAQVVLALRHWRKNHLLRFALPLLVGYTLMIGFTFGNLGIIARQRTPVFPFVLLLLTCVPKPSPRPD